MKERIVAVVAEPVIVIVSVAILALGVVVVGTSNESQTADDHGSDLARGPSLLFLVQIPTFFSDSASICPGIG